MGMIGKCEKGYHCAESCSCSGSEVEQVSGDTVGRPDREDKSLSKMMLILSYAGAQLIH